MIEQDAAPTTMEEYRKKLDAKLSWLEKKLDAASSMDERFDLLAQIMMENIRAQQLPPQIIEVNPYQNFDIDMTVARTDKEYPVEGNFIFVQNPLDVTGTATIKLERANNPEINLLAMRRARGPFTKFFISNTVGTGTLRITIGLRYTFEIFPVEEYEVGSTLNSIGDVSVDSPTDLYILYRNASTGKWECRAFSDWHLASLHELGGAQEISVAGLGGLLADDQHVLDAEVLAVASDLAHKARHQNGGADEISVAALSGLLADDQHVLDAEVLLVAAALVHAARHQNGGADEISVAGLSGLLADDQHVLDAEVLAVAEAIGVAAGLITTHTGIATAHQDAPGLIATHTAIAAAHHAKTVIADLSPIALADLDTNVCSETEADGKITTHKGDASAHHTKYTNAEAIAAAKTDVALLNPSGLIAMWHGTIANIPSGWVICDGNNSTPNLLAKFVEGVATAATDPGATGGATGKTTSGHIHTQPTHTHTVEGALAGESGGARNILNSALKTTSASGDDNVIANTDSIADIRPLFYDIAFIMKT